MVRILLVEDDREISQAYRLTMSRRGHEVAVEFTGAGGVLSAVRGSHDVVVLDAMLPDLDGFDVCRQIRKSSAVPIIMLTARDQDSDIVGGLEAGADDYIIKPVAPAVLEARIRAVMRRNAENGIPDDDSLLRHGPLTVNLDSLIVTKAGAELSLTPTELRLLAELLRSPGQVLSREQLLDRVWLTTESSAGRSVDAAIQRLRSKIEDDPAQPVMLHTVRGFGYRIG